MPHLDVPGSVLYYETEGHASSPAVLLIHAGIATLRMWDPVATALADEHFVIRYDTRGFGGTASADRPFSDREDARALLSHLGIERATVVGASRGGGIAVDLALESPDRVAGLVLVGSGVSGAPDVENTAAEREFEQRMTAAEDSGRWDELIDLEVRLWAIGPGRDERALDGRFVEAAYAAHRANRPRFDENPVPAGLVPPAFDRLEQVAAPTLVVVGDHDITDALVSYDLLTTRIPDSTGERMPDTAHLPSLERPDRFAALVTDWLRGRHL